MITQTQKRLSQDNKQAMRNPWVIGWLALVIVVFGVNAGMVATAVVTNPGLVDAEYYEKGRDHEAEYQRRMQSRNELGWQVALELPARVVVGAPGVYRFHLADKHGVSIKGAQVSLTAYRPSDASADFAVPLKETAPGQYDAYFALPMKGIWDLKVAVVKGEHQWDMARRVSVRSE